MRLNLHVCYIVLAMIVGVAACASDDRSAGAAAHGTTMALTDQEQRLWITSPDDDRLVRLDPATLAPVTYAAVGTRPVQLAPAPAGLLVALGGAPAVAWVDPRANPPAVRRVSVPCGGTYGAVTATTQTGVIAVVTCPWDDRLLVLDAQSGMLLRTISAPGRPLGVARQAAEVAVAFATDGVVRRYRLAALRPASGADPWVPATAPAETMHVDAPAQRSVSQLVDVVYAGRSGEVIAVYQAVDNDFDRSRPPSQGGYGAVIDENPRIEPRIAGTCAGGYARFDGGVRVFSGPRAIAFDRRRARLWVVNRFTDNVAVLRCNGTAEPRPLVASVATGRGGRGVLLTDDGRTAFVDLSFDRAVARIALPADGVQAPEVAPALVRTRPLGEPRLSAAARRGRAIFHDATDPQLTPSGVLSCATCHFDAADDGLNWFLHTINTPRKLRRTPAVWQANPVVKPLHWDGEFTQADTLARVTTQELMGGLGLGLDFADVAAYLREVPPPPPPAVTASQRAAIARGEALFRSDAVGCTDCHMGSAYTDGRAHAVVTQSTDPDARLAPVMTPSLRAVRARPPYLHDGRASTLRAVLTEHNPGDRHGMTSQLSSREFGDLLAFVRSL